MGIGGVGPSTSKHCHSGLNGNKNSSMKASHVLSSKDMMNKTGSALFNKGAGNADFNQPSDVAVIDSNKILSSPMKPPIVPLSQGGFFHRN